MFKRFAIGFTLGFGLMYWYIYEADHTVTKASNMFERSASQYRNDRAHDAAREVLGTK